MSESETIRAAMCRAHGPPENVVVEDVPRPVPGPGEIRVRVGAAAVNFPDVLFLDNKYQVQLPVPFIPGSEYAGEVTAVGDGVDRWVLGDRVFGALMNGAFAEELIASAANVKRVPDEVELRQAAGFWVAYATAYHSLRSVAAVQPGETVLVLGAAGGVGLAAVELAKILGATVIAAASSPERLDVCRSRGADHGVDYSQPDWRNDLKPLTRRGVDVVIDPVGGPYAEPALRSMAFGGRFVTIGYAAGDIPRIPLNLVLLKGMVIMGFEMRTFGDRRPADAARDEAELMELLVSGRIDPYVCDIYPLEQAAAALRQVADRRATGKVLVVPERGDPTA